MSYSNISNIDKSLCLTDKKKLRDYDIISFSSLKMGDHFRYTSNKYREQGRKLSYGVVHGFDKENKILEVNGYTADDEDQKYPNWNIDYNNKYKHYVFYTKRDTNKFEY